MNGNSSDCAVVHGNRLHCTVVKKRQLLLFRTALSAGMVVYLHGGVDVLDSRAEDCGNYFDMILVILWWHIAPKVNKRLDIENSLINIEHD